MTDDLLSIAEEVTPLPRHSPQFLVLDILHMTGHVMTRAEYRRWRFYAEALTEQAISILDTIDGDADLEDGGGWGAVPRLPCRR